MQSTKIWTAFLIPLLFFLIPSSPVFAAISFSISNPQQQGQDEFTIDVALSGLTSSSCPNGSCYLQAAFTAPDPIKYFGFTKNQVGQFYAYDGSPDPSSIESTFFAFQPVDGNWSGELTLRVDKEDTDYKGPGSYNIKAWRYTGNSTSYAGSSDTVSVEISGPTSTPIPTSSPTTVPTNIPSSTPKPTPTPTKTPTSTPTTKPTSTPKIPTATKIPTSTPIKSGPTASSILIATDVQESTQEALPTSILGESTESAVNNNSSANNPTVSPSIKETKILESSTSNLSKILIGIGVIFLIACGILAVRAYIKSRKENENIYHK